MTLSEFLKFYYGPFRFTILSSGRLSPIYLSLDLPVRVLRDFGQSVISCICHHSDFVHIILL